MSFCNFFYLLQVSSFKILSHDLWFRQISRHTHRPKCSYHDINDAPNCNGGHNFFPASFWSAVKLASSLELGKYGCNIYISKVFYVIIEKKSLNTHNIVKGTKCGIFFMHLLVLIGWLTSHSWSILQQVLAQ